MKYKRVRKPSINKRIAARTKGKATRALKRAIIPGYGKKGMGILNPKRAIYNKVYNKTTISVDQIYKEACKNNTHNSNTEKINNDISKLNNSQKISTSEMFKVAMDMNKGRKLTDPIDLPENFPRMSKEEQEKFDSVLDAILVFLVIGFFIFLCWIWF